MLTFNRQSRRQFLRLSGASLALVAAPALLTGCPALTETQAENYLNAVLSAAKSILSLTNPTDSWYQQLASAITALEATEGTWNAKTINAVVESALTAIDAVLAVIPITAVYSPLIDIATTAIELILNTFLPVASTPKFKAIRNPHRGRVALKNPNSVRDMKKQYNEAVYALQLPASAKI